MKKGAVLRSCCQMVGLRRVAWTLYDKSGVSSLGVGHPMLNFQTATLEGIVERMRCFVEEVLQLVEQLSSLAIPW